MTDAPEKRLDAWAVEAKLWPQKPPVLLGVGWFGWPTEPHLQGCRTALFRTRREARRYALDVTAHGEVPARAVPVRLSVRRRADD
jgi:hypothetical protein